MFIQRSYNNFEIEIVNAPPFSNTYSTQFDGVDDYVSLNSPNYPNAISFSAWFKTTNTSTQTIWTALDSNIQKHFLRISNTQFRLRLTDSGGSLLTLDNTLTTQDGNWHHVAFTTDGTTATDGVVVYFDGVALPNKGTLTNSGLITTNKNNIGTYGATTWNFNGNIDEVSLYNSELSASQISDIYNLGTPTDLTDLSPITWYRMGDNGAYKSPQWLLPSNENKDKVSNYSFDFDGVDDFVDCGNPTDLQITGAFTLSAWTKLDSSVVGQSCIMSKDSGASGGQRAFSFWGKITDKPVFYIWNGATNVNVSGTTNIADDTWHHVAVVYVPSTSIRIYVDGVLEGINTTSIPASINNAVYDFKIGVFANTLFPHKGLMDEVSVFNSDQSANIATLYNSGTPTTLPSGAIAHYKMGEEATFSGGVWTVPDNVGSNDGTSNAMTIDDRIGEAPNSTSNSVSYNMDEVDRVEDTP